MVYVVDPIYAAVAATWFYRATRKTRVVVDMGDLVYELAKEMGRIGPAGLAIVKWAEQTALHLANAIVVRGSFHRESLIKQGYSPSSVVYIPDGVDLSVFHPMDATRQRAQFGLRPNEIVAGGVGTIDWSTRRHICFGWDLIEALPLLPDVPVKGILVGDGNGRFILETRARELGVADRVVFTGRIPYAGLPRAINAIDICLLTQLNTPMGWVRTTGKLPLYLACDRYVIASQVGEAARVLEPFDMLLPYEGGGRDARYPLRLAEKIRYLSSHPEQIRLNGKAVELARQFFDYDFLASSLASVIDQALDA
jgi:glycosyltransferase involved in cell wall biosynthesis